MSHIVVGDIDVEARLERPDGAYLHQETVRMLITFRNRGANPQAIPYLVSRTLTFELRTGEGGEIRRAERRFRAAGPLRNMPEPEAVLAPREDATYRLPLDLALGLLGPGSYQVRLVVDGLPVPFTTPWFPLTIANPRVGAIRSAPSSTLHARELHTVWRDDAVAPAQVLLQTRQLRDRALLVDGRRLGDADGASEPAVAIAPAGVDPAPSWVAWVARGHLVLARSLGETVSVRDYPLPAGRFRVAHPWVFSEGPDGSGLLVHGVLVDDEGGRLFAFSGDSASVTVAPQPAGGSRIAAIATVPVDSRRLAAVVARTEGTRTAIEGWTFELGRAVGPVPLASIDGAVGDLAADYVADGRTSWAAEEPTADRSRVRVIDGVFAAFGSQQRKAAPGTREIPGGQGPWTSALAYDEGHRLWVLRIDAGGARVFGPDGGEGIAVDLPPGFRHATLVFRRGELPQVLGLDPEGGFVAIPVDLSRNEPKRDDDDE